MGLIFIHNLHNVKLIWSNPILFPKCYFGKWFCSKISSGNENLVIFEELIYFLLKYKHFAWGHNWVFKQPSKQNNFVHFILARSLKQWNGPKCDKSSTVQVHNVTGWDRQLVARTYRSGCSDNQKSTKPLL